MSAHALVWWAILVGLVVIVALAGVQAARAFREVRRISDRLEAMEDLPLAKAIPRLERDMQRIETAVAQIEPLLERANRAVAEIRRDPIPPELVAAIRRVRAEIADFRALARR